MYFAGMDTQGQAWTGHMLDQAEAWERTNDHRYLFLRCYATMTSRMLAGIDAGRFQDGPWVARLLDRFAEYYFDALAAYEHRAPGTPAIWQLAHDRSRGESLHVLQHIMLGINAHINYDLVLTLHEVLLPEWPTMDAAVRQRRMADHETVNAIIAETIDTVQDEIIEKHSPMMDLVDKLMGRMDEWMLAELIRGWRKEVWHEAMAMLAATSPEEKEEIRREVEYRALRKAEQILRF